MTEYSIERSEDVLTLRRTKSWVLGSLVGALFPLAGAVIMGWLIYAQPLDKLFQLLCLVPLCGMAFVFYRLLIWGRCIVFDKASNRFLIDGRVVCALSDLISVRMEGSQRSALAPRMGRLRGLHLRTAQGKDITLKHTWEGNPEYGKLTELVRIIAIFIGMPGSLVQ